MQSRGFRFRNEQVSFFVQVVRDLSPAWRRWLTGNMACFTLVMAALALTACGGGSGAGNGTATRTVSSLYFGQAQKGPFQTGSSVMLYELEADGSRTGRSVSTVTGALGRFVVAVPWEGATEFEVTGRYFDELAGVFSAQPRTLSALVDIATSQSAYINCFTHMVAARMQHLMLSGQTFASAQVSAYAELRTLLDLAATGHDQLMYLDISDSSGDNAVDNANLLLFSAAMLASGISQAEFEDLAGDFSDDGLVNNAALQHWLRVTVYAGTVDLDQVKLNLESLDGITQAPGFDALNNSFPEWVNVTDDSDADGLTDAQEILVHSSDALEPDTDGDGLSDGWEVTFLFDPLVAGEQGTDPDGDGLINLDEFSNSTHPHLTDTDSDGLTDAWEVSYSFNPIVDQEAAADPDGDGLNNLGEFSAATHPHVADTDTDGMADGWEVTYLFDPLLAADAANDPDGDGLSNLDEFNNATHPNLADSDGDSYSDSSELNGGGDPNDPASLPLVITSLPGTSTETGFSYFYPVQITWGSAVFTLDAAPAGMIIDPVSGSIDWTPTHAQTGNFNVSVRVNSGPYTATQSFVLTTAAGNTGDINEDGVLDGKDILLSERIVLGLMLPTATQSVRGDVVADGAVRATDVAAIQRLALGF